MKVSYTEYQKHLTKISGIRNKMPTYIPSPEELERIISYKDKPRLFPQDIPVSVGRKYEYANKVKFVEGGRLGEACMEEQNVCMFLLHLLKTAKPEDEKGKENLAYVEKRLKELLIIKSPDEED